ncbi:MAG: hypothetical protein LBS60_10620 [Deltaproteobacteria bacterium]|nr:hypothetical protein [Deltaproteobacteria bacterium]
MTDNQITTPRSVDIIKEQLADLDEVFKSVNRTVELDFTTKSILSSLEEHKEELIEELKAAEWLETQNRIADEEN